MVADISSRSLKAFIAASPLPMTLASPVFEDCPLVVANDAFLALTGYRRDEIIGRNCRFLQGPASEMASRARLRAAIDSQSDALVSITNYRKDGALFQNLVFVLPIFAESGALLYMLGSQCDVSLPSRKLTALEHAQVLDEAIEATGPRLARQDSLRVLTSQPCVEAARGLATKGTGTRH